MSGIKCSEAVVVSNLIRKFCFDAYEFVPAIEKLGGLLLAWKSFCNVNIVVSSAYFINCLIFDDLSLNMWQLTFVYDPNTLNVEVFLG